MYTEDNWKIALSHYPPLSLKHRYPVILCHGLGANRYTFEIPSKVSLAQYLSHKGYDIWVLELRGHGLSEHPRFWNKKSYSWTLDDYLFFDLPTAISYVLSYTKKEKVHWIGHSMGGILLYTYLTQYEDFLQSGIAVASSLEYSVSNSWFRYFLPFKSIASYISCFPFGLLAFFISPFAGYIPNFFERFLYWPSNMDGAVSRMLYANGFHTIPSSLLIQLATTFEPGGLRSKDGKTLYQKLLGNSKIPILALVGDKDFQCSPQAAQFTLSFLGTPDKQFIVFGPEYGHKNHYGHFDILVGRNVEKEVFPVILQWLDSHDKKLI